jgi:hypothetical protein
MSGKPGEDSIAEKLEGTRWDYSQRDDPSFLFAPIGEIFGTVRWDGQPEGIDVVRRPKETEDD